MTHGQKPIAGFEHPPICNCDSPFWTACSMIFIYTQAELPCSCLESLDNFEDPSAVSSFKNHLASTVPCQVMRLVVVVALLESM
jgi:hypothetical protein